MWRVHISTKEGTMSRQHGIADEEGTISAEGGTTSWQHIISKEEGTILAEEGTTSWQHTKHNCQGGGYDISRGGYTTRGIGITTTRTRAYMCANARDDKVTRGEG